METLKYIELAVSKDANRFNLTGIYRDKNHLVATDGYRLHYSNGLTDITPHYLDGRSDIIFPDWQQVMPKDTSGYVSIEVNAHFTKLILDALKALKPIAQLICKIAPFVFLESKDNAFCIKVVDKQQIVSACIKIPDLETFSDFSICLNLLYLQDALSLGKLTKTKAGDYYNIKIETDLKPVLIENHTFKTTALIMPMRK